MFFLNADVWRETVKTHVESAPPVPVSVTVASGLIAEITKIDWGAAVAIATFILMNVGGLIVSLVHQWKKQQLECEQQQWKYEHERELIIAREKRESGQ
jgi:hypothetical protein